MKPGPGKPENALPRNGDDGGGRHESAKEERCSRNCGRQLLVYIETNFRDGETLMRQCAYPEFHSHKAGYEALTRKVRDFSVTLSNFSLDLMTLLRDWLSQHIMPASLENHENAIGENYLGW